MSALWIDGSKYQSGSIDFASWKAQGVDGVVWNAGDPSFVSRLQQAHGAGLRLAAYWYLNAAEDAAGAAQRFLGACRATGVPLSFRALDIEEGSGDQSARALAFLHVLDSAGDGVPSWLYTGGWFIPGRLTDPALARYPLWDAAYQGTEPAPPRPWTSIAMWQFTSSGHLGGYSGSLDESHMYVMPAQPNASQPAPAPSGTFSEDDDVQARLLYRGVIQVLFHLCLGRAATTQEMDWWEQHAEQLGAGGFEWALTELAGGDATVGTAYAQALSKLHTLATS